MMQMEADVKQAVLRVSVPLCEKGFKMVMFNGSLTPRSGGSPRLRELKVESKKSEKSFKVKNPEQVKRL